MESSYNKTLVLALLQVIQQLGQKSLVLSEAFKTNEDAFKIEILSLGGIILRELGVEDVRGGFSITQMAYNSTVTAEDTIQELLELKEHAR